MTSKPGQPDAMNRRGLGDKKIAEVNNQRGPQPGDRVREPLVFGRETIESIVVAFAMALLFRAFEAEAFVIPTGSMAPTLMGRHKDLVCDACGMDYRVGCSAEEDDQSQGLRMELSRLEQEVTRLRSIVDSSQSSPREQDDAQRRLADLEREGGPIAQRRSRLDSKLVAGGICPNCGLPVEFLEEQGEGLAYNPRYPSFNGDRILVNKVAYDFSEPDRWDVVVFRYPEDAKVNYIKRLIGLPGETVSIAAGDIWTSRKGAAPRIARKPDDKLVAMLQCVHDADHIPKKLIESGWPRAWSDWALSKDRKRWQVDDSGRSYTVECKSGQTATMRFRHMVPTAEQWQRVYDGKPMNGEAKPSLITDFQPYNALPSRPHWVSDLALETVVTSHAKTGQITLELIEAGEAHRCIFDFSNGEVAVVRAGQLPSDASAVSSSVKGEGTWTILFANIDDQLSLFINGNKIDIGSLGDFEQDIRDAVGSTPVETLIKPGNAMCSDMSPVGIISSGAHVTVEGMRVLRDVYYLTTVLGVRLGEFYEKDRLDFPLEQGQFFMLGDNSAASKDSRLWMDGHHVDRHLLIGEAMVVFWPHAVPASWAFPLKIGRFELRLPSWPNFARMRKVR
ncbi:MAG: signal peptidase I [Pirellulales bacterium]